VPRRWRSGAICAANPALTGWANFCRASGAGFWLGVWHGFIAAFVFVASLFRHDLGIYELHNNGPWYNFGYLFGLACFWMAATRAGKAGKVAGEAK